MISASPTLRFLWRGSVLLIASLALWWFVLLSPSLFLLRLGAVVPFAFLPAGDSGAPIEIGPGGEWNFHIPIDAVEPATPERPTGRRIHSLDFTTSRDEVAIFTLSLPVFWAIMLAAPEVKRNLRAMLWGTLALAAGNGLLVLVFAEINAHWIALHMYPAPDPFVVWLLSASQYLVVNLIPFAAPVAAALALHGDLRRELFDWDSGADPAAGTAKTGPSRSKGHRTRRDERASS